MGGVEEEPVVEQSRWKIGGTGGNAVLVHTLSTVVDVACHLGGQQYFSLSTFP